MSLKLLISKSTCGSENFFADYSKRFTNTLVHNATYTVFWVKIPHKGLTYCLRDVRFLVLSAPFAASF